MEVGNQVPAVRRLDNASTSDKSLSSGKVLTQNKPCYPLDSDLCGG